METEREWQQTQYEEDGGMKAQIDVQSYGRSQFIVLSVDPAHHNLL